MAEWIEYIDAFEVEIHRGGLVNQQEVDTDPGLLIRFGQRASKRGSRQWKLKSIVFWKDAGWTAETAQSWWCDYDIRFVSKQRLGTKIPEVNFWLEPVAGVYVLVCLRGTPKTHTLREIVGE